MKKDKGKDALLEQLRKTPIIEIACAKANVSRATFYRWKKDDPDFAKAVDEAMREGQGLISDVAESQLISSIKEGHITAIMYWLKHHHDDYRTRVELSGSIQTLDTPTPEQQELIQASLRLAQLPKLSDIHTNESEQQTIE